VAAAAPRQVSGLPVGATAFASPAAGWAVSGALAGFRLLYTEDAGATWTPQLAWYGAHYGKVSAFDSRRAGLVLGMWRKAAEVNGYPVGGGQVFAGAPDAGAAWFAGTQDAGATWTLGTPPDRQGSMFHFLTPRQVWLLISVLGHYPRTEMARTEDGGATWSRIECPDDGFIRFAFSSATDGLAVAADRHRADILYATTDGGTIWTRESLAAPPGVPASAETWLIPVIRPGVGTLLLLRALSRRESSRPRWEATFAYAHLGQHRCRSRTSCR